MRFNPGCGCCATLQPCVPCVAGIPSVMHLTVINVSGAACLDGVSIAVNFLSANQWTDGDINANPCTAVPAGSCSALWVAGAFACTSGPPAVGIAVTLTLATKAGNVCTFCETASFAVITNFDCANYTGTTGNITLSNAACLGAVAGATIKVALSP